MGATFTKTITADGDHFLATTQDATKGTVTIVLTGTGTWKLQYSPDGGTTLIDMLDASGNAFTGTGNKVTRFELARGSIKGLGNLYLNVTGASGLSLTARVHVG